MHSNIVHGLNLYFSLYSAPCRTVLLTLKSLDINLTPSGMRPVDIHQKFEQFDPWFEKINYEKVVPTIVDNDFTLWESRAIAKYLVQKYATKDKRNLYPSDITEQARIDRLLCFDQGLLYQSISNYFKPQAVYSEIPNPLLGAEIEYSLQLLERIIGKRKFALGGIGGADNLTIADLSIISSLSRLESMDYSYDRYEGVAKYVEFLKDYIVSYRECCQEGISLTKDWARKNLGYSPRYMGEPTIPYEHRIDNDPRI